MKTSAFLAPGFGGDVSAVLWVSVPVPCTETKVKTAQRSIRLGSLLRLILLFLVINLEFNFLIYCLKIEFLDTQGTQVSMFYWLCSKMLNINVTN